MAHVIVIGAGLGGVPAAFDLRKHLPKTHRVTLIGARPYFEFTPSNPWIAAGWRSSDETRVTMQGPLERKGVEWPVNTVTQIDADNSTLTLDDGKQLHYDYLVIATGPRLTFEEVPGLGPDGFTQSVCSQDHSVLAWQRYQEFLKSPGPIVGDSTGLMESELREHHIKWITNAKMTSVTANEMTVQELDESGVLKKEHKLPFAFSAVIPAFKGVDAVAGVPGLCNPRGFVLIDKHQRSPKYPKIFSVGVCVAIPPVEATPVATGAPKTGYMIESMVSATAANIVAELAGKPAQAEATWNAICLADFGDTGAAFVALPQIPPRGVTWSRKGKWVHLAKIAFEKYFMRKVRTESLTPVYETYVLKALGIMSLKRRAS
jgi:sulfide:quinone oxidoreductase